MSEESLIPYKCWIGPKQFKNGFTNRESELEALGDKWQKKELRNEKVVFNEEMRELRI